MLGKYNFRVARILLFSAPLLLLYSCSSDDVDVTELLPTELEITVLNEQGQPVPGAEVRLYRTLRSFEIQSKEIVREKTGSDGKVLFSNLQPVNYYMYASYKDQNAGLIRSNYGNYDEGLFGSYSNIQIGDYLTENGLTRVTVSTLFSKPINPSLVSIDELRILYVGHDASVQSSEPDSSRFIFALVDDFDPIFDDSLPQANILSYTLDAITLNQAPNARPLGYEYQLLFEDDLTFDLNELLIEGEFGFFNPPISLSPFRYYENLNAFIYDGYSQGLSPSLDDMFYDALFQARKSGEYPNRVVVSDLTSFGKSDYIIDFVLSWN